MVPFVDLHLHTNCSDGSDAPAQVVARAAEIGFAAMAVTDHDTLAGLPEARAAALAHGIEFLDGVEISSLAERMECHVVGLGIRSDCAALHEALELLQRDRLDRAGEMVRKLNALGIPIALDRVQARAGGGATGRLHVAAEVHALGVTASVQGAFDKFIGRGRRAYVAKKALSTPDAIDLIHQAGGLAFLAHPGIGSTSAKTLNRLLAFPFDGIEVYHSKHSAGQATACMQIAVERNLLVGGGSDCHGSAGDSPPDMGKVRVPYVHFQRIIEELARRKSGA